MTLKKICKCDKIIDMVDGMCDDCKAKVEEATKARHRDYRYRRTDKDAQKFYNSKPWKIVSLKVKTRDNGLCLLCWSKNKVKYMDTVHHIIELDECIGTALALMNSNLISLCEQCHQEVHKLYKTDKKKETQDILRSLLKKGDAVNASNIK